MKLLFLFVAVLFVQDEIPFKADDEFLAKIDLKFKTKGQNEPVSYSSNGERIEVKAGPQPFLEVDIAQIKIREDEAKIVAFDSRDKKLISRKTSPVPVLHFEMGFVNDLKNGTLPNEITVYFLSTEKKQLRKIVLTIKPDGTFLVNGKWHGKF